MVRRDRPPELGRSTHRRYLKLRSVLYDRVTSLPAFSVLLDDLRALLDERRWIGVLHLEIGNLDVVESLYGWQVFDRVRGRVADALRACVGRELPDGTLLALIRVAGGRFVAFVPHQPGGAEVRPRYLGGLARLVAQRVEEAFHHDAEFEGLGPDLEFRAGHALLSFNPYYRFERRVYAAVDEARSLRERRQTRRQRSLGLELRRIIDEQELVTLFQPVVDLASHEVLGWEALTRGPEGSPFESPSAMFAVSDRLGVAADLDQACRAAALRASPAVASGKIFLNALPASFAEAPADARQWPARLRGLAALREALVLEFPERSAEGDPEGFVATLERLKRCGFGVALDDVGTGFASQAILERLRPDYLKLDVSLVREIDRNLIKQEILHSLIRIAKRMGASVIAEGVESEAEAKALLAAGARYGQGFLFARPAREIAPAASGRPGDARP